MENLKYFIGKLSNSYDIFPYLYEPLSQQIIIFSLFLFITITISTLLIGITVYGKWNYLWYEWITSTDHKKIGIMYIIIAFIMLFRGFSDAILIKIQQAISSGDNMGYLIPEHFDQIFTAHGVIMIFFVAMPIMFGLMNFIIPLQIGSRDVAFPYLNSLSFWLFFAGVLLLNISLIIGEFAHAGWLAYPPLSGKYFSPGVGMDYYLWAIQISGIGTTISGINFFVTILKMRCKGMKLMMMPIFVWTSLCSVILIIISFPILTATLSLLTLDRYLDMCFFTYNLGGDPMMYVNLIWIWGHPEVYILILPAFGIFSEIAAVFSRKSIFGYESMVYATIAITFLSFIVWAHHFFTMGAGANINVFFGIMTMIISIPTGVKIFNWIFTMYKGSIQFSLPMYWLLGFIITFSIGGMTGVMLAIPGLDFQLHNSLFLVAHFHNVIIGGVLFGYIAGIIYWFPKMFGFKLEEKLGKYAFFCWIIGFCLTFIPLYYLGLLGMTRRVYHYDNPEFQPFLIISLLGAIFILFGVILQVIQIFISFKNKNKNKDKTGDPWDGRTLEWMTSSPVSLHNFTFSPVVDSRDAFWHKKLYGLNMKNTNNEISLKYKPIHMPKNTPIPFYIGICSFFFGFSMVWHIWWLTSISLICMIGFMIQRSMTSKEDNHYYITIKNLKN